MPFCCKVWKMEALCEWDGDLYTVQIGLFLVRRVLSAVWEMKKTKLHDLRKETTHTLWLGMLCIPKTCVYSWSNICTMDTREILSEGYEPRKTSKCREEVGTRLKLRLAFQKYPLLNWSKLLSLPQSPHCLGCDYITFNAPQYPQWPLCWSVQWN